MEEQNTQKETYERRVEEQVQAWEKKIEELKKRLEEMQGDLKEGVGQESQRYQDEIESLKVKRDAAMRLLSEVTDASGRFWSGFQDDLGQALEGAGKSLINLAERLRKTKEQ